MKAASATWNGTVDATWANILNWSALPAPGSGETATFNNAGNGNTTINLGGGVTIASVLFDTASAAAYTIGSGGVGAQTLTLNDTANVWMNSAVVNNEVINANVVLGTAIAGTTTVTNGSTTRSLTFAGTIQGGTGGTAGAKIVNFGGVGTNIITGAVTAGGASSVALRETAAGTLLINGSATSSLADLRATGNGTVIVNGQTITVANSSQYGDSAVNGKFDLRSGTVSFNGGITGRTAGTTDGNLYKVSGGNFNAASMTIVRSATDSTATATTPANSGSGIVITGGSALVTGVLSVHGGNSVATALIDGGVLTVNGETRIADGGTSTRWIRFEVRSGSFTNADTVNGIVLARTSANAQNGSLFLTGGTTTAEKISFGISTSHASSQGVLTLTNAGTALFIGTGGIVKGPASGYTTTINLYSGTLGAKGDWASSLNMALAGSGVTIKAADGSDTAKDITLSGVLSGANGFTKTGAGVLTLSGANTYTGATPINGGTVVANVAEVASTSGPFGNPTTPAGSLTFGGGTLRYSANNTSDYSVRFSTAGSQSFNIDTAGQNVTFATALTSSGGTLTKLGSGTLSLSVANTYTGGTTVSGGTLRVNSVPGSGTGSGAVAVNSGGLLGGNGIISGVVTVNSGGGLSPGTSVGTNIVGSLTMNAGSTNNFEFNSNPANDKTIVTTSGGLVINGGTFNLYAEGGTTTWITPGTYNLIQYSGALSGSGTSGGSLDSTWTTASGSNPHIANPQIGYLYSFGTSGGWLTVTIAASVNSGTWGVDSDGNWSSAGNWTTVVGTMPPRNTSDTATFGTGTALRTVTLDANVTNGTLHINNANSFVIANVGNTLTFDNAGVGVVVNVTAGTQNAIQTAVALSDNVYATVVSGKSLAVSGAIANTGAAKTLTVTGGGTLALSGNNSYGPSAGSTGTTFSGGGTLQVGHNNALGAGDLSITVSSGTLQSGAAGLSLANNIAIGSGLTATLDTVGNSLTLGGIISGTSGALTKIGSGILTLGNANTYYNNTIVSDGTLKQGIANAIPNGGSTTGWLILDGGASAAGTFDLNGYNQAVNALSGNSGAVLGQIVNNSGSGTSTLTVAGNTTTFAGLIKDNNNSTSGQVALGFSGSPTLTLSGANTYSGGTTIGAGQTLKFGGTSAIGTGALTINGGTLDSTVASLVNAGNNAQNWNADFTFTGSQSLDFGSGTVTMGASRSITVSANTLSVGGINEATAGLSLTKTGGGKLTINGASGYSGGTTMNNGNILVNNSYGLGSGSVAHNASSLQLGNGVNVTNSFNNGTDTIDLMLDCPSGSATWSGPIGASGSGGLRVGSSGGTLNITGSGNSRGIMFTYGTVVLAGSANLAGVGSGTTYAISRDSGNASRTLSLTMKDSAIWTPNNGVSIGGGKIGGAVTFTVQDSATFSCGGNTFDFHSGGTAAHTVNLNGGSLGAASFIKSDTAPTVTLNWNGGTLQAKQDNASYLPSLSGLTVNVGTGGAKVDNNGFDITIGQALIHDAGLGATPDGGLVKRGAGTLTLSGANTYTGPTTVTNGTLRVDGSIGAGATAVKTNATLGGGGTISGIVTIESGGTLAPGASIGTLTLGAPPALGGTTLMEVNSTNSPANSDNLTLTSGTLDYGGALIVTNLGPAPTNGTTFTLFTSGGYGTGFASVTLPTGSTNHWKTNNLLVNGTISFTNSTPVAGTKSYSVAQGEVIVIALSSGTKSLATDADGDTLTVTNIGGTNAVDYGTAVISGGGSSITYTNTSGAAGSVDLFSYTVSDGFGGLATNSVSIQISPATGANLVSAAAGGGNAYLTYAGIPGTNYALDHATSIVAPITWNAVLTNAAQTNGFLRFTNNLSMYPTNDFYRTRYVP